MPSSDESTTVNGLPVMFVNTASHSVASFDSASATRAVSGVSPPSIASPSCSCAAASSERIAASSSLAILQQGVKPFRHLVDDGDAVIFVLKRKGAGNSLSVPAWIITSSSRLWVYTGQARGA